MTTFSLLKYGFLAFAGLGVAFVVVSAALKKRMGALSKIILLGVTVGTVIFVDAFFIEPNWIQVRNVKIHDRGLAAVVGDTMIVHITDIHLNHGLGWREEKMIAEVNKLNADIIFFTGDIIDDLTQVGPAIELFKRLHARLGIYAVPGDTDRIVMDSGSLRRELEPSGIRFLVNQAAGIHLDNGNILWVAGIDSKRYPVSVIDEALRGIPADAHEIALAHRPAVFENAAKRDINLVLAGDTHGGQVGIDFLIKLSAYANRTPYMRGLFKYKNTQMYVNRGIGMKTLNLRFLCRPEIAVLKFV